MNKKVLISSIIAVVILSLPSTIAMPELSSDNVDIIEHQNTGSSGKPDLIITDIIIKPGHFPNEQEFFCRVKNIGDVIAEKTIFVSVDLRWCFLLGMLPIYFIGTFDGGGNFVPGLNPGETIDIVFAYSYDLPRFGFYRFYAEVNPNFSIDESAVSNNFHDDTFFVLFGNWR